MTRGTYPVHIHATRRETDDGGVALEPVEDFLVLAWSAPPTPPAPPVGLRTTSGVVRVETSRN